MSWSQAALVVVSAPLLVWAQSTFLHQAGPWVATPSLAALLVVGSGFRFGALGGVAFGLWIGALVGAGAGSLAIGESLLYALVGWLAGLHSERRPLAWTYFAVAWSLSILLTGLELCFFSQARPWPWSSTLLAGILSLPFWPLFTAKTSRRAGLD